MDPTSALNMVPHSNRPTIAEAIEYPISQFGGTETLVREICIRLSEDFRIFLISPDHKSAVPPELMARLAGHIQVTPQDFQRSGAPGLSKAITQAGIQFAHFHIGGIYDWNSRFLHRCPVVSAWRAQIPYLLTTHGIFDFQSICGPRWPRLMKWLLQIYVWPGRMLLTARSRHEYLVSDHDRQAMENWFWPVRSKFGRIYHSQLPGSPPPAPLKENRILCVGTIGARKGQWILAEAFALVAERHPEWSLSIVGRSADDALTQKIRAAVEKPGIRERVEIVHGATDDEVNAYYRRSSIFAMPSFLEGLGLSLQEAIYHGCCPIGSHIGGIPELIENNINGITVPSGDVQALAAGLDRLMCNQTLRDKYQAEGYQLLARKEMSAPKMAEKYARLYRSHLSM